MGKTSIEWCDVTWNPTRGCSRVSAGCDHCYAMREARRHDHPGGAYEGLTKINTGRTSHPGVDWRGVVRLVPEMLDEPLRWRKPQRVFVNSMSDLFHEVLLDEAIYQVFAVMALASRHTFQVLTKRPARMLEWSRSEPCSFVPQAGGFRGDTIALRGFKLPLPNVWLGVSVEDQATADERIPLLLQTPAAVRFISLEPQLGHVDLSRYLNLGCANCGNGNPPNQNILDPPLTCGCRYCYICSGREKDEPCEPGEHPPTLSWVIQGGESGPGARYFAVEWARSVRDQCKSAGVPYFLKQMGRWITGAEDGFALHSWLLSDGAGNFCGWAPPIIGPAALERPRNAVAFTLGKKGGDANYWPADLRVREFPA